MKKTVCNRKDLQKKMREVCKHCYAEAKKDVKVPKGDMEIAYSFIDIYLDVFEDSRKKCLLDILGKLTEKKVYTREEIQEYLMTVIFEFNT